MEPFDQPFLSIIIPTFNEVKNHFLWQSLQNLSQLDPSLVEIILVDRDSSDGTLEQASKFPLTIIHSRSNTRAQRLNEGYAQSKGRLILFHHPRSIIDPLGIYFLQSRYSQLSWGGFTHQFDHSSPLLTFTSWYSNQVRGTLKQILYLDHCIYFRKDLFERSFPGEEPLPNVDIFEDTLLSLRLQKLGDMEIIPYFSLTSSIRFQQNGAWKQSILNQWMKIAFYLDLPLKTMNKVYEKGLSLNSQYTNDTK